MSRSASPVRVLAIAGSLRRDSHNRALLRAAAELAPASMSINVYEHLGAVPVFNEDLEDAQGGPAGVARLRTALAAADGLLIATPEYNQSVPGVVKNMIDWLSRSEPVAGLAGRPVAVTGATTGPWGTRIAQTVLRQMLVSVQALVLPAPTLFVGRVDSRFAKDGRLADDALGERLHELVSAFAAWIRLTRPDAPSADSLHSR
jgi:chromate reductase